MFTLNEPRCFVCNDQVILPISHKIDGKIVCGINCVRKHNKRIAELKVQHEFFLGDNNDNLLKALS